MARAKDNHSASQSQSFDGFDLPRRNYFFMPGEWIDITASITNLAELKVVQYILRHTWSFQEFGLTKRITIDEFIHGRRRKHGTRMDQGTGLSEQSVRNGLASALKDGLIVEEIDDRDRGRIKKYYGLKMKAAPEDGPEGDPAVDEVDPESGTQDLGPGVQSLDPCPPKFRPPTPVITSERTTAVNGERSEVMERGSSGASDLKPVGAILKAPSPGPIASTRKEWVAQSILSATGDEHSLGCYRLIAERCRQELVFEALSLLKQAQRDGSIRQSRGALFVGIVRRLCQERGLADPLRDASAGTSRNGRGRANQDAVRGYGARLSATGRLARAPD